MKTRILLRLVMATIFFFASMDLVAQVRVRGYTKKDGTYVQPHYRSSPNSTKLDNWSTKGNVNPYTGRPGTVNPDAGGVYYAPQSYPTYAPPVTSQRPVAHVQQSPRRALVQAPALQSGAVAATRQPGESYMVMRYDTSDPILEFQKRNALKGAPESQYAMGIRYLTGNGVRKDPRQGRELIEAAAGRGNLRAKKKLSQLREEDKRRKIMAR